jgi:hypothetical protein
LSQNFKDHAGNLYSPTVVVVDSSGLPIPRSVESPEFSIAQNGLYNGKVANFGYCIARRSLGWLNTSVMGDISNYLDTSQANNNEVVLGTTYYIRSSNVQDAAGGTGIRTMRINYLNAAGIRAILNVTMNGTTAVSLGSAISFIQYMESETLGSSGVAAGDIIISTSSGIPTVAQTVEKISAGDGRSMSGRVKVPSNFTMYLLGWNASAISSTMDTRLRAQVFTDDRSLSQGFHFQQNIYLASGQIYDEDTHYMRVPSNAQIKISAIPGAAAAGNRADASFHFLLVQN